MKRFLLPAILAFTVISFSASAEVQGPGHPTKKHASVAKKHAVSKPKPVAAQPVEWPALPSEPVQPEAQAAVAPAEQPIASSDTPTYYSGIMVAPGMSMTINERPSTDYNGRPLRASVRRSKSTLGANSASSQPAVASTRATSW